MHGVCAVPCGTMLVLDIPLYFSMSSTGRQPAQFCCHMLASHCRSIYISSCNGNLALKSMFWCTFFFLWLLMSRWARCILIATFIYANVCMCLWWYNHAFLHLIARVARRANIDPLFLYLGSIPFVHICPYLFKLVKVNLVFDVQLDLPLFMLFTDDIILAGNTGL